MKIILENLTIPKYEDYTKKLSKESLWIIDHTRITLYTLWVLSPKLTQTKELEEYNKIAIGCEYSFVLWYERKQKNYPFCILWFDTNELQKEILIRQLQWIKWKVGYKCNTLFDSTLFYSKLIEDNFLKNWIKANVVESPKWLEDYRVWNAFTKYDQIRAKLKELNSKYLN